MTATGLSRIPSTSCPSHLLQARYTRGVKFRRWWGAGLVGGVWLAGAVGAWVWAPPLERVTVDYPRDGAVFPPDFPAPQFEWRDANPAAAAWAIEVSFASGVPPIRLRTAGEPMRLGEIDPRATAPTNRPPELTPQQKVTRTWRPDAATWKAIQTASSAAPATVTVTGYASAASQQPLSRGAVRIRTAKEKVGAPVFYRDVPLMPSETEKGVIKPLAANALPLIAWRLRDVTQPRSRLLMDGLPTCANCHSASSDGKTLGLDVDGPQNDKGLYALVSVQPKTVIRNEDVIAWSTFRGKLGGRLRVGFMSQVSPDGRYVVTMINDTGLDENEYQRRKSMKEVALNFFVANFMDYRFLQVFYPTRGILAWYSRETGRLEPLPGADDPRYVHTNATWSPDGKYLVFARAEAKEPYPPGVKLAAFANDPLETRIRYDLYRIPFNGGRGGKPEPIPGASNNGMSNSFPKVSPDGRWIVFVQARNGLLMRPDGKLYIVPAEGGTPRLMTANTPLMNSWHSFSPNGRWLVFSSKSRTPYTQMFLTHIDENGNDSPPVLIENATAANRAVNIPEFLNIAPDGLLRIEAPVTDYYRVVDRAAALAEKGDYTAAAAEWRKAIELGPAEAMPHNNLGVALARAGKVDEAIPHYQKAIELSPNYPEAHNNLGEALAGKGRIDEAVRLFEKALELNPRYAGAYSNLGGAWIHKGVPQAAVGYLQAALELDPNLTDAHNNLGVALAMLGRHEEAVASLERAAKLNGYKDPLILDLLAMEYAELRRFAEAAETARKAAAAAEKQGRARLAAEIKARLAVYEAQRARD